MHEIRRGTRWKPLSGLAGRHQELRVLVHRSLRVELRRQGLGMRLPEHPDDAVVAVPESQLQRDAARGHRVQLHAEHLATAEDGGKRVDARLRRAGKGAARLQAPQHPQVDRHDGNRDVVLVDAHRVSIGGLPSANSFKRMPSGSVRLRAALLRAAATAHAAAVPPAPGTLADDHRNRAEGERAHSVDPRPIAQPKAGRIAWIVAGHVEADPTRTERYESAAVSDRFGGREAGHGGRVSGEAFKLSSSFY